MVIGWDIGGVNTKMAVVHGGRLLLVRNTPYELQRDPDALQPLLRQLAREVAGSGEVVHAVTMTAELSQYFRTKREGVAFVLDAVERAFPDARVHAYTVDGRFLDPDAAREEPFAVAASNWAATARLVAPGHPDVILIDMGTTTTDITPIVGGQMAGRGRTDPERLHERELVYSGVLRTPVEAIVREVPYLPRRPADGALTADAPLTLVSAESFALVGDVHLWLGRLRPEDYTVSTPDRRPATREFAGERLCRVICADREMLDEQGIDAIAWHVSEAQEMQIAHALSRVRARHSSLGRAVVTGLGAPIAAAAARRAGLTVLSLADALGDAAARSAPAAAVALLLGASDVRRPRVGGAYARTVRDGDAPDDARRSAGVRDHVDTVIKVGGGLLAIAGALDAVTSRLARMAGRANALVVPGGGPFADAVRQADAAHAVADDAAHWMAVLAMDQMAHLLAARIPGARLVHSLEGARSALRAGAMPVLAPCRMLRESDPLPHRWSVTSDSIAAWVSGRAGARRLVLVKPVSGAVHALVDPHFESARPATLEVSVLGPDDLDRLETLASPDSTSAPVAMPT